jgi:membrane-bound lytic murein transglycosylase B
MGQCQFMPTTFISYAVDFDGDGRRDIWNSRADVLGSIANYLNRLGWRGSEGWGRDVRVGPGFDARLAGIEQRRPVSEWSRLGVTSADGAPLSLRGDASLLLPEGAAGGLARHRQFPRHHEVEQIGLFRNDHRVSRRQRGAYRMS